MKDIDEAGRDEINPGIKPTFGFFLFEKKTSNDKKSKEIKLNHDSWKVLKSKI